MVECHYSFDPALRRDAAAAVDASNRPGEAAEARVRCRVKEAFNMNVLPDSIAFYAIEQVVAAA